MTLNDSYKAIEVGHEEEEAEYDTIDTIDTINRENIDDWKWPNKRNWQYDWMNTKPHALDVCVPTTRNNNKNFVVCEMNQLMVKILHC